MIVFVAGMQRSGSTFSFNVVREVLSTRGQVYYVPTESVLSAIAGGRSAQHVILKAHDADEVTADLVRVGAMKTVCTVRKPEDAIASWMETFGFSLQDSIDSMIRWIKMFETIKPFALVLRYEDIDRYPLRCTRRIAKYVCPDSSVFEAIAITRKFNKKAAKAIADKVERTSPLSTDAGITYFDNKTFLHRRHVSSLVSRPASERVSASDLATIRASLAEFVDREGYLLA